MLSRTPLELYKEITFGTRDSSVSHVPAAGKFYIDKIEGEAAFNSLCVVKILFDGVVVWSTVGSSKRTKHINLVGDAAKEVELVLDAFALASGSAFLGLSFEINQER